MAAAAVHDGALAATVHIVAVHRVLLSDFMNLESFYQAAPVIWSWNSSSF
jgi:hypothetical protein